MPLDAIKYDSKNKTLSILNQLLIPHETEYEEILSTKDAFDAIREMKVRGAPAIAIVGLLSVAVEINSRSFDDIDTLKTHIIDRCEYLCFARPTAVNIRRESDRLTEKVDELIKTSTNIDEIVDATTTYIESLLEEDVRVNRSIGDHGADHLLSNIGQRPLSILTHCNTGSLATCGYGTALGVLRSLQCRGKLGNAYCTETRPYNQGARLTAYELVQEGMNGTLICDNMVAYLMVKKGVDGIIVGADRVTANGDTANKIGTFQLAVIAKSMGVPFYVASPVSTIDLNMKDGSAIPIEERPAQELKSIAGVKIAPDEINVWNPAFDVTPANLITGIITEFGVTSPDKLEAFIRSNVSANK